MKKVFFKKLFLPFLLLFPFICNSATLVSGEMLQKYGNKYDGKKIVFEGEAIGDIMGRGENMWVNLKSGDFVIGIWMNKKDIKKITHLGRYGIKGDIVRVEGIFNQNCKMHYGETDIHAEKVEIIREGEIIREKLNFNKVWLSFILSFTTLVFIFMSRKSAQKESE